MSRAATYRAKVRKGELPTPEESIDFLREWHAAHPAATSRSIAPIATERGVNSYALLARCVPKDARIVVDLACGDGELCREIVMEGSRAHLVGVDLSEEDLALAATRLAGSDVELRCEPAQALSLDAGSVDAVLSHYAFMLMRPLDPVLIEIRRVLKPGGVFAAIVPERWNAGSVCPAFASLVDSIRRGELPAFPNLGLGDPRTADEAGLRKLFATGFGPGVAIERVGLPWPVTPAEMLGWLANLYWFDLLTPEAQQRILGEGRSLLAQSVGPDGKIASRSELLLVRATRA